MFRESLRASSTGTRSLLLVRDWYNSALLFFNQADVMQQEAAADTKGIPQLQEVVSFVLDEARRQGASECEADANVSKGLSVTVRLGEVDTIEYQRDRGLGVTVYFGKRKGSASTADLSQDAVRQTVEKACAIARYTAEDPYAV